MVLICCPLQKKVKSKVWRQNYWTFAEKGAVSWSENGVKASVGSTEENPS